MSHLRVMNNGSALIASRENRSLDFKGQCDPNRPEDCCEIIKDIVAMANSGGGTIIIGVCDDGALSGIDVSPILNFDPAKLTDKIARYTGAQFSDFTIEAHEQDCQLVAIMTVGSVDVPMVFIKPGTYDIGGGKQKNVFSKGQVYFRHGAKSEPGDSNDLRTWHSRQLSIIKKAWLGNIKKIVAAPPNYHVSIALPNTMHTADSIAQHIRVTDDPSAPVYGTVDHNLTHPHRAKEVIQLVNEVIGTERKITTHDILCVRKFCGIEDNKDFFYRPNFSSPRYSDSFVLWLISQHRADELFFDKVRERASSVSVNKSS